MAAVTCYYGRGCGSRSRYGSGQNVDAAEYVISFSIFFHVFVWLYADEETAPLLSVSGAGRRRGDPFCRGGYRISHVCVVLESELSASEGAIQIRGGCVENKVLIYVKDEAYGRRLLEFLETRHPGGIDWELVTERGFERRKDEKGVWLTDDPGQTEDEDKKVWYLTASTVAAEGEICRYQTAEALYQDLMKKMPGCEMEKGGIYSVFSPQESQAHTVAAMLALYFGKKSRCLWIRMTPWGSVQPGQMSLADGIFMKKGLDGPEGENPMVRSWGRAFVMPGFSHYEDYLDCEAEEFEAFLKEVKEAGGYEVVILEFSCVKDGFLQLLNLGQRIFVAEEEGRWGEERWQAFDNMAEREEWFSMSRVHRILWTPAWMAAAGRMQQDEPEQVDTELAERLFLEAGVTNGRKRDEGTDSETGDGTDSTGGVFQR